MAAAVRSEGDASRGERNGPAVSVSNVLAPLSSAPSVIQPFLVTGLIAAALLLMLAAVPPFVVPQRRVAEVLIQWRAQAAVAGLSILLAVGFVVLIDSLNL